MACQVRVNLEPDYIIRTNGAFATCSSQITLRTCYICIYKLLCEWVNTEVKLLGMVGDGNEILRGLGGMDFITLPYLRTLVALVE